jgi:hypothetical protein
MMVNQVGKNVRRLLHLHDDARILGGGRAALGRSEWDGQI